MAEARAAVNTLRVGTLSLEQVTSAAKLRGVQVHGVDGGILIVIPSVKFLWRQLVGRIRYIGQNFQTLCWPAPVWGVLVAIALFTAAVLNSASDSWLRNNWVANFLWSVDENLIGFLSLSEYFPRGLRLHWLLVIPCSNSFERIFRFSQNLVHLKLHCNGVPPFLVTPQSTRHANLPAVQRMDVRTKAKHRH
mmetsp:Transcript_59766/g.124904  ORF Transcript_59766/g.124904 Transcript_59766/m.124904 type:complete len:192 (+) Transcript_59766:257-832(+)